MTQLSNLENIIEGNAIRIIAIDPGRTTGVAYYFRASTSDPFGAKQFVCVNALVDWLISVQPTTIIMETFRLLREKALSLCGQDIYASEVIGAVKVFCVSHNIPLIMQYPPTRNTVKRSLLELMGLWQVTVGMHHARDAAKHLVVYLLKHYAHLFKTTKDVY